MDTTHVLLGVAGVWLLGVLIPGPNFLVTVRNTLTGSVRLGLWTVAGIASGTVVWVAAGYFGIALLFAAAPWLYSGMKVAGGAYLIYLGLRMIFDSRNGRTMAVTGPANGTALRAYRIGLLTILSNPKTATFITGLFAAVLPPSPTPQLGLMTVTVMVSITLSWYGLVALVMGRRRVREGYLAARRWLDRVVGAVFAAFGLRLLLDR